MKNKKKLIILSIVAILLIVVLSSASYAYFTTSGSTGTEETITSGTMALSFSDGPQINATNLAPGDYIEKTFSVTNTGTLATTYDVYLSEVVNTFVQKNDLVYEITSNDGGYNTPNQVVVPNQEAKIVDTQSIGVGVTHHYTLKITYKLTNQIQNDNMGRGFTAKISINEYNLNSTEKLLKLLDISGNLVDKQMISSGVTDYYYNLANTSLTGTTNIYCNNGGIPRIENNQLIVTGLTVDTECKMSNNLVDTINNKLTTSKTGIVMTNNQSASTQMVVQNNKEVVLDLNGKELNYTDRFIYNYGNITINDATGNGSVYATGNVIANRNNASITINNGTFESEITAFPNNGSITLNGGNYYKKTGSGAIVSNNLDGCSLTINDAYFEETFSSAAMLNNAAGTNRTININGGTFKSIGGIITNASVVNIYDGKLLSESGVVISNTSNGTVNISNGYFETASNPTVSTSGQVNISGGHFYNKNSNTIFCNNGTTNITGGLIESMHTNTVVINSSAKVVLNGSKATFDSNGNYVSGLYIHNIRDTSKENNPPPLFNYGELTIYNGTFEAGINHAVIFNNNEVKIYDGEFKSLFEAILRVNAGHTYIYGGTYYGSIRVATHTDDTVTYSGSTTYVCGGRFIATNYDIANYDSTATIKYKSNVIWEGKTSPVISGTNPETISLDDTIVCPS